MAGGVRRVIAPQRDLELRRIDGPAGIHRQPGQDAPLERPAGSDLGGAIPDEQRTEDAHLHPETLAEQAGRPCAYQVGWSSGPRQRENSSVA